MEGQPPAALEFRILGPLEVVAGDRRLDLGPRRQRAVLARLLIEGGRPVSVDRLVEDVWGGRPPAGAVRTLRSYLSRLRAAFAPRAVIVTRAPGYALDIEPGSVDASRFEALAAGGRELLGHRNAHAAAARLTAALSLWRGDALCDLPAEAFVTAEAGRLDELRLAALEDRIEAELELGRHAALVAEIEALVDREPLRERLWAHLMTALYRSGRQADALAAYQRARAILDDQLGLEPGEALRRLEAAILRHEVAAPQAARRDNLPASLTSFVGRDREADEVIGRLADHRLVTIAGPGGAGKTRLAVECARRTLDRFPDGVWMVDLAPLGEPALLAQTVATAIDRAPAGPVDLAETVERLDALVVLDNCEHLGDAVAPFAERLLASAPALRVLATSREPLAVPGENVFAVGPLPVGDESGDPAGSDAVRLFLDRSAVPLDEAMLPAVARVCRELDGMPLAIEIAAAQTRLLTPREIADRLADRFELLTYWSRTAVPRHRTLRASLDWSDALLEPHERALFHRLAVFAGGFTIPAAEAVAAAPGQAVAVLRRLVDASLVVRGEDGSTTRFRLLETVRQYGAQRLRASGDAEDAAERHARFYAGLADEAASARDTLEQPVVLARLDAERANLRAALEWAHARSETEVLARLARGLGDYWRLRGLLDEGELWLARAVAACAGAEPSVRADLHALLGHLRLRRSAFDAARAALEQAAALAPRGSAQLGRCLHQLAFCWRAQGRYETARALLDEALAVARATGDMGGTSHRLGSLADIAMLEGRFDDAERLYAEAWEVAQPAPPALAVAYLDSTARLAAARGDLADAADRAGRGLVRARELGDQWHVALTLTTLAHVARRTGDAGRAIELLGEALVILRDLRDAAATAEALEVVAGVALDCGDADAAAVLHGAAGARRRRTGAVAMAAGQASAGPDRRETEGRLGLTATAAARSRGERMVHLEACVFAEGVLEQIAAAARVV